MSTEIESLRGKLEGAELASEVVRAPDGNLSVVAHSNQTAADRAWALVSPVLERQRLAYNGANAMKGVHKRRADNLRRELDHAKAALAGDSEGVQLFMADCEQRVARLKEQAELSARGEQQAESERDAANAILTRVRAIHAISDMGECVDCRASWPCPTIDTLDAPAQATTEETTTDGH